MKNPSKSGQKNALDMEERQDKVEAIPLAPTISSSIVLLFKSRRWEECPHCYRMIWGDPPHANSRERTQNKAAESANGTPTEFTERS